MRDRGAGTLVFTSATSSMRAGTRSARSLKTYRHVVDQIPNA
jgi:hypothetical protein